MTFTCVSAFLCFWKLCDLWAVMAFHAELYSLFRVHFESVKCLSCSALKTLTHLSWGYFQMSTPSTPVLLLDTCCCLDRSWIPSLLLLLWCSSPFTISKKRSFWRILLLTDTNQSFSWYKITHQSLIKRLQNDRFLFITRTFKGCK